MESQPCHLEYCQQQALSQSEGYYNLIAKAAVVLIDIFMVDVVAGFLKGIADSPPLHGHQVDSVLEGKDVEEIVVEDVADLNDLIL